MIPTVIGLAALVLAHTLGQLATGRALGVPTRLRPLVVEITAPRGKRALVIAGGFVAAYLGLAALAFAAFAVGGIPSGTSIVVGDVVTGYDADGKLVAGDRLATVDGERMDPEAGPSLAERVNRKAGAPIVLGIVRDGEPREVTVLPKADGDHWRLGIRPRRVLETRTDIATSAWLGLVFPLAKAIMIGRGIYDAITGPDTADPGGPTRIVEVYGVEPSLLRSASLAGAYILLLLGAVDLVRLLRR